MKENTDEKSLVRINENSIFYKIKQFFKRFQNIYTETEWMIKRLSICSSINNEGG